MALLILLYSINNGEISCTIPAPIIGIIVRSWQRKMAIAPVLANGCRGFVFCLIAPENKMSNLNNRRIDDWERNAPTNEQFGLAGDLALMNLAAICEEVQLAYSDFEYDDFELAMDNLYEDKASINDAWLRLIRQ